MDTLKRCPFCGSNDIRVEEIDFLEVRICCYHCGALGPNDVNNVKAIEMWNMRREHPPKSMYCTCNDYQLENFGCQCGAGYKYD